LCQSGIHLHCWTNFSHIDVSIHFLDCRCWQHAVYIAVSFVRLYRHSIAPNYIS
jgi:hypothetical protein